MSAPLLPDKLDWSSAIGNFILNFGVLDWNLLAFLEVQLADDDFTKIKRGHFHDRVEALKSAVAWGAYSEEQKQAFAKFFDRVEKVRELRNHIAHGLMCFRVADDLKSAKLTLTLPRDIAAIEGPDSGPDTMQLEFSEFLTASHDLAALIEEFSRLALTFAGAYIQQLSSGVTPIPVRRLAPFIERTLYTGLQWVTFEPNGEALWERIRQSIETFLNGLWRSGAFQGAKPEDAYFVKCDATTTTQDAIKRGIVNIQIGFAPIKPAEFVTLLIQQQAGPQPP